MFPSCQAVNHNIVSQGPYCGWVTNLRVFIALSVGISISHRRRRRLILNIRDGHHFTGWNYTALWGRVYGHNSKHGVWGWDRCSKRTVVADGIWINGVLPRSETLLRMAMLQRKLLPKRGHLVRSTTCPPHQSRYWMIHLMRLYGRWMMNENQNEPITSSPVWSRVIICGFVRPMAYWRSRSLSPAYLRPCFDGLVCNSTFFK